MTRLRAGRPRFDSRQGLGRISLRHHVQTGSGTSVASYPMGTRGSFHGVKQQGHEADHSLPYSAECVELYLHSLSMSSLRGAHLSKGTTLHPRRL
jgi:hypothetical protein